jgi:hypothetical protein
MEIILSASLSPSSEFHDIVVKLYGKAFKDATLNGRVI